MKHDAAVKGFDEIVRLLIELMEIRPENSRRNSIEFVRNSSAHKVFDKILNRAVETSECPIQLSNLNWPFVIYRDVLCYRYIGTVAAIDKPLMIMKNTIFDPGISTFAIRRGVHSPKGIGVDRFVLMVHLIWYDLSMGHQLLDRKLDSELLRNGLNLLPYDIGKTSFSTFDLLELVDSYIEVDVINGFVLEHGGVSSLGIVVFDLGGVDAHEFRVIEGILQTARCYAEKGGILERIGTGNMRGEIRIFDLGGMFALVAYVGQFFVRSLVLNTINNGLKSLPLDGGKRAFTDYLNVGSSTSS